MSFEVCCVYSALKITEKKLKMQTVQERRNTRPGGEKQPFCLCSNDRENKTRNMLKAFALKGPNKMKREKETARGKLKLTQNVGMFKQNESSECSSVCVWSWQHE